MSSTPFLPMRLPATIILLAALNALAAPPAHAESLYKCDAKGAVTIQSDPCPSGSTQVWQRDATPEPGPTPEEISARAALASAEAQRLAEQAHLDEQERIKELLRRDDEARLRADETAGNARPERKSECTMAHEFSDAANAKDWLMLSQSQRDRIRDWVIDKCRDPRGNPINPVEPPTDAPAVTL